MRIRIFFVCLFIIPLLAQKLEAQVSAQFSSDNTSGCAPIRVQFKDESTGGATAWSWNLGNGTTSPLQNPSTTYFNPGTYTVRLVAKNGNDSSVVVKTNYITVYGLPKVSFSGTPLSGCLPLTVQFTDASTPGSGSITNWKWDFGDGFLGSGKNPAHTYTSQGNFQVTLTVTNSNGCSASDSKPGYITGFDSLKAKFGLVAPVTCTVPATFNFIDSSIGSNIVFYEWRFGDGTTSNLKNPSHTYLVAGIYDVSLRVRNSRGCEEFIEKKGIANAGNYKADFSFNPAVCINKPVTFTNTSNPLALVDASRWTFGNGQTSNVTNPTTSFSSIGTFPVKLVTKFGNCFDSIVKMVTVLPKATLDFDASIKGSCKTPLTVNFTNLTSSGTVLKWDFGNGDFSTQINPTYTYTSTGSFDVRLIVMSASGCVDTLTKDDFIKIEQPVIKQIKGLPWEGCFPLTNQFELEVVSIDPVAGWNWDFGDGTVSTQANPVHTYSDTGSYKVTASITTAQGCTASFSSTLKGGIKPSALFEAAPKISCPHEPVSFTDMSSGPIDKWLWSFGDGGTSNQQNPQYQYNDTGWMHVKLIVSNNGCADSLQFNNYIFIKPPISRFTDSFVCGNQFKHYFIDNSIEANYWKWYIDDTDSIETQHLEYTFTDTGLHKIKLFVKNDECEHTSYKDIYVLDEKAAFSSKDSGFCGSTFVTFNAGGPATHPEYIKEYEWQFGANAPIILTDTMQLTYQFTQNGQTQISLKITDINGCSDSSVTNFNVRQYGPKADFIPEFNPVCANTPVSFIDTSRSGDNNPIKIWKWNFGDGSPVETFTAPPFVHQYTGAGVYDVSVTVQDSLGCESSITKNAVVEVFQPIASFYSPDTLICLNAPVSFSNQSSGINLKYQWDFGNNTSATTFNATARYPVAGQYDVRLIITDSINCRDTLFSPKYIMVGNAVAMFTMSDSFTTCPPLIVSFTNQSFNKISSSWNFGNGNTSSLTNPSHTYTTPGTFNVRLRVTGNGGCTDTIVKKIIIEGPSGSFNYTPLGGCPPVTVNFTSNTINTKSITWDFSDGSSSVTSNFTTSHVYDIPGTYIPKIILSDDIGCKLPIEGPDTIVIVGARAFIQHLKKYNFCDTSTISFFDSTVTTDVITSYRWDFGDGTNSNLKDPVHFYSRPGRYRVVLEVRTLKGCVSRDTLPELIIIVPTPVLTTGPNSPVCVPSTVQFAANWVNRDTSVLAYKWDFGNGNTSSQFTPVPVRFDKPGTFQINFTATHSFGCIGTSNFKLQVNDTPRLTVGPAAFICRNKPQQLNATGAKQYQWTASPSLSCTNCANPIAKPLVNEVFTVLGIDSNNCRASKSVEIKVKQPARITVGRGDTLCAGEAIKLQASGTEQYLWSPPAGLSSTTSSNPTAAPNTTTRYMIVGYDSLNCFYDTGYISIVVYPIPKFNIIEEQITANTGTILPVKTTSSADITRWHWSPPFGLNCTNCPEPVLTVGKSYVYTARVFNEGGCTAVDKLTVNPICSGENVFIPNTFSPNGDGQNDEFYPRGRGISLIKNMRIYNRWGEMLYEAKDFAINDRTKGWNGIYNGARLTPDVYVYTVEVICENSVVFTLKGNVTLLR